MTYFRNKNILVTGAAGITGHATVKRLLEEGAFVKAVVHKNRTLHVLKNKKLTIVQKDLLQYDDCIDVCRDMDIVINLVAYIRGAKEQSYTPVDLVRNNVVPSINMMDAAVKSRIDRFGFVGSSTMYPDVSYPVREEEGFSGEPHRVYTGVGWMKRYCETVCKHFHEVTNTKFAMIRTTAIYGPHDAFNEKGHVIPQLILKAKHRDDPFEVWGDGEQVRDFIYVDDVVDALLNVIEHRPSAVPYNVATGKATTIKELAKLITEIYQYEPKFNFDVTKPSMIPKRLVDVSKISDDLGWRARIDLRAGLQKTVSWLEEQG